MNQKPPELVEQFISLRAKGVTLAEISEQLKIPRSTIGIWSRKHAQRIANERAIELEHEAAKMKNTRRARLAEDCALYSRVLTELDGRKLADIPTDRLAMFAYRLRKNIVPVPDTVKLSEPITDEFMAAEPPPPPLATCEV